MIGKGRGGERGGGECFRRTSSLNAFDGNVRNRPVDFLQHVLPRVDDALLRSGCGREEARLAGEGGAEHFCSFPFRTAEID